MRITPDYSEVYDVRDPSRNARKPSSPFVDELKDKLREVNTIQNEADDAMKAGAIKGPEGIHETMIQLEEADISLRLLMKVRNKALEAYQEIMRMQF